MVNSAGVAYPELMAKLKHLAFALFLAMSAMQPAPCPAADISPAHARDLHDIIEGCRYYDILRHQGGPRLGTSLEHQYTEYFLRQITREEFNRRLALAFSEVFTPRFAEQMAKLANRPVLRKEVARKAGLADAAESAPYSKAETVELRYIDSDPILKEFAALQPKMTVAMQKAMSEWSTEVTAQLNQRALKVLAETYENVAKAGAAKNVRNVRVENIGFEPWDQIISASGYSLIKFTDAFLQLETTLNRIEYQSYFSLPNLAGEPQLAKASDAINQAEAALNGALKQLHESIKERAAGINRSPLAQTAYFRKSVKASMDELNGFVRDYGAMMRIVLAQHRQVVGFLSQHADKLSLKDGKLLFDSEQTRQQALPLIEQMEAARKALGELVSRREAGEQERIRRMHALINKLGS